MLFHILFRVRLHLCEVLIVFCMRQAEGVYNQRLQNLAVTLDKVIVVLLFDNVVNTIIMIIYIFSFFVFVFCYYYYYYCFNYCILCTGEVRYEMHFW